MQNLKIQLPSNAYRCFNIFGVILIATGLNSCATIPEQEFSDYLQSFAQVRKTSELILMDYAAAKKEKLALDQKNGIPYLRQPSFQTNQLVLPEDSVEDVAVRFKAWEIVDNYNQALVNLIAGKAPETEDKTKELLRNIINLSGKAIVNTASNISPAFAALNGVATELGKIYEQHKTLSVLIEVAPIIDSQLIAGMKKDTALFYKVRYGLNNYAYQQINAKIGRKVSEFIKLAYAVPRESRNKNIVPMIKTLNDNLAMIAHTPTTSSGFKKIVLTSKFGNDKSAATIEKLTGLESDIMELVAQAKQQDRALDAYRQALTVYTYLLNELQFQLRLMLQVAEEQQSIDVLATSDLQETVLKMQQSYLYYQNNKP
jgi:hypothetical protein